MSNIILHDRTVSGWRLNVYEQAAEATGSFYSASLSPRIGQFAPALDRTRSEQEAGRRAQRMMRRYCAHNGLNRLGTLTFKPPGCFDQRDLRIHVAEFFKKMRNSLNADLPYLWVPEWQKTNGLHVHFAVGRYVKRSIIESAWPHGFVHIKILTDTAESSGVVAEARVAARYLAKYVGKDLNNPTKIAGLHRYDIAQGFKPIATKLFAPTLSEVMAQAQDIMKREQSYYWSSNDEGGWSLPPAVYVSW